MAEITLTPEQASVFASAKEPVVVRAPDGRPLGTLPPPVPPADELTPEEVAELKRRARSPGPWYTGEQVHARLLALEAEWERTGGFDEAYAREFVRRLNETDPGFFRS